MKRGYNTAGVGSLFDEEEPVNPYEDLEQFKDNRDSRLLFMSMGSGSSGNCCYIGTRCQGVLIDAGVEGQHVERSLAANGISMQAVKGILITHDHSDHVRYLYNVVRYHRHIAIYCTPRVLEGMLKHHGLSRRINDYHHAIYKEIPFQVAGMTVTPFEVLHDGSDNVGFHISTPNGCVGVATDLGTISDRAFHYLSQAQFLIIEANYDAAMLRDGFYPEYLKARIRSQNGHMDNVETGAFLKQIYTPELRNVFLCHLSKDNNTPAKALTAVKSALTDAGVQNFDDGLPSLTDSLKPLHLVTLPRYYAAKGMERARGASPLYVLER